MMLPDADALLRGGFALGALLPLAVYLDRLRCMSWRTHLWRVVAMHLSWALWLGIVAYDAVVLGVVEWQNGAGIAGAVMWLVVSWTTWPRGTPPVYTESGRMPLDEAPLEAQPLPHRVGRRR